MVTISSVTDLFIFTYSDGIPEFMSIMNKDRNLIAKKILTAWSRRLSLEDSYVYDVISNPEALRGWLSSELGLPYDKIIHGGIIG